MPTSTHDIFTELVAQEIGSQLKSVSRGDTDVAAVLALVRSESTSDVYLYGHEAIDERYPKHTPDEQGGDCIVRSNTDRALLRENISRDAQSRRRRSERSEMKTAYRLHNSVYSEMGTSYGDVVRRCLYQLFDVRDMSLDNEELQQKVFDEIVAPLSDDLMNFNGKSRIK